MRSKESAILPSEVDSAEIDRFQRVPRRFALADGTLALATGTWTLAIVGVVYASPLLGRLSPGNLWLRLVYTAFTAAAVLSPAWVIVHFGTRFVRERITYPRLGYVSFPSRRAISAGVFAAGAVWAGAALFVAFANVWSLPVFVGMLAAGVLLTIASIGRAHERNGLAGAAFGTAAALQWLPPERVESVVPFALVMAAVYLAQGGASLYSLARNVHIAEVEQK